MTTQTLSPVIKQRFVDNNGAALAGGQVFVYLAGTTTKTTTYTDSSGGTPNRNPVILDARGEANIWIPPNVGTKWTLAPANDTDPPTNSIWTVDNVVNSQLLTLFGGTDTGVANAYVLSFTANFSTLSGVNPVIYWIPSHTNTSGSTIAVNGLGPFNILNGDGTALSANEIVVNQVCQIIWNGANWVLINPNQAAYFASGSFTATVFGCTTAPTKTVTWVKSGKQITLNVPATGGLTSNSTSFGMSGLPSNLWVDVGAASAAIWGVGVTNNGGAFEAGAGDVFISAASGNINFEYKGGLWTNVNGKSFSSFVITYFNSSNFA